MKTKFRLALAIVVATLTLGAIVTPIAQAASFAYVNNIKLAERTVRTSGTFAHLSGAKFTIQPFSADGATTVQHLESYRGTYPGGTVLHVASGTGTVIQSHATYSNARNKCWWDWPFSGANIGSLTSTCSATYSN